MTLYIVKASEYLPLVKHGWLRVWRKLDASGIVTTERVDSWYVYRTRNAAKIV